MIRLNSKNSELCTKRKRKIYCQKWALICHVNVRWLIGIILGEIIFKSSNWQHIQRLKITIFRCKLVTFKIGKDCQMFNQKKLSTKNIKFYWFVMKIKKFSCQFDDTIEVYFLLGINIWGLRSEWVKALLAPWQKHCVYKTAL